MRDPPVGHGFSFVTVTELDVTIPGGVTIEQSHMGLGLGGARGGCACVRVAAWLRAGEAASKSLLLDRK